MRKIVAFATLAVALGACGVSTASTKPHRVVFGTVGGNRIPFRVTVEPNGRVRHSGAIAPRRHRLSHAETASLSQLVRRNLTAGLVSRMCSGANPDFASEFIRAFGRTVTVHGSCEPRFTKLWNRLGRAVGLR